METTDAPDTYFAALDKATTQRDFMKAVRARGDWSQLVDSKGRTVAMLAVQRGWSAWSALLMSDDSSATWGARDEQGRSLWFYALSTPEALSEATRSGKLLSRIQKGAPDPTDLQERGLFVQWLCAPPSTLRAPVEQAGAHPERWLRNLSENPAALLGGRRHDLEAAADRLARLIVGCDQTGADVPSGLAQPEVATIIDSVVGALAVFGLRSTLGLCDAGAYWPACWRGALAMAIWFVQRGSAESKPPQSLIRDTWLQAFAQSFPPPHKTPSQVLTEIRDEWSCHARLALPAVLHHRFAGAFAKGRAALAARASSGSVAQGPVSDLWSSWPREQGLMGSAGD